MQISRSLCKWAVAGLIAGAPSALYAQGIDIEHYEPTGTTTGLAAVKGGQAEEPWSTTLWLDATYMRDPLVAIGRDGERIGVLVSDRVGAVIGFSLGLDPSFLGQQPVIAGLDAGVALPFIPLQRTAGVEDGLLTGSSRTGLGLGDPRIQARIAFATRKLIGVDLALIPVLRFPLGAGVRYAGSKAVVFTPEIAASRSIGPAFVGANLGVRIRGDQSMAGLSVGEQLVWRAGAGLDLQTFGGPADSRVGLEWFGLTPAAAPFSAVRESPVEILATGQVRIADYLVTLGVGGGLTSGYGAPLLRVTLGGSWAPRDADRDGIRGAAEHCPARAEDKDGFEDADGCPDPDNDADGILDDNDACPDETEDRDSFKDEDGCPELDNDADSIFDAGDRCPNDAEDKDGYQDEDGCPDLDNDEDAVPDARDRCPNEAEDKDEFRDADGCPDPDNDGDSILDATDKCPTQAEDLNGLEDDDGCPDAKNDKDGDGIPDSTDKCPNEPEDRDEFEDDNGCPDPDNDADTVADAIDACPTVAEDADSFEDTDGCPDYDNDFDGIADTSDRCPSEPETINAVEDEDGCPDQGAQLVKLTHERIEISDRVYFDTDSDVIQERSFALLDQIGALLKNHAEVAKVRVEGHTDDRGAAEYNLKLSQQRAESVVRYLTGRGVEAARLEAAGYGITRPVASNKSAAGREINRRVEFIVANDEPKP